MSGRLKLGLVLLLAGVVGSLMGIRASHRPARLIFLAVGQGDCSVFETSGFTVLIDVGPEAKILSQKLRDEGVTDVSLVLLSHPDSDHIGGLPAVLKAFPEAKIGISDQFRNHPDMLRALQAVASDHVIWFGRKARAKIGSFELTVATPEWHEGEPDNDGSMFLRFGDGKSSVVFSGDAGIPTETRMIAQTHWQAQILHAGHHGSRTATGEAWLNQIRPKVAIISCGRENRYGHPHQSVLDALTKHDVQILRTDRDGDLVFEQTPEGFALRK